MLDNTLDASRYPLNAQKSEALSKRRIGIGVTGVADTLVMLDVRYGSEKARSMLGKWMQTIQNSAYLASSKLAEERGKFPKFSKEQHLVNHNICRLSPHVQKEIELFGLRNSLVTTIAPTGITSLFAGNVSSGIEPVFSVEFHRKITLPDGRYRIRKNSRLCRWSVSKPLWKEHTSPRDIRDRRRLVAGGACKHASRRAKMGR